MCCSSGNVYRARSSSNTVPRMVTIVKCFHSSKSSLWTMKKDLASENKYLYTITTFYFLSRSVSKPMRKNILQLGIEPMTKTGSHDQCSHDRAVQEEFRAYFSSPNDILTIERTCVDTTCTRYLDIEKLLPTKSR